MPAVLVGRSSHPFGHCIAGLGSAIAKAVAVSTWTTAFEAMALEFDHLFICTDSGACEADLLASMGLLEGTANTHPGQGTANRRFFFHNAMLELLWVHNAEEATSDPVRPTRLWERWTNRLSGACPFGISLRPAAGGGNGIALSGWDYRPPYLPESVRIVVGANSDVLAEPMLFQIPFGKRPDQYPADKMQPLAHPAGMREVTRVELVSPAAQSPSPQLQAVTATDQIRLRAGSEYCVELGFDGEVQGRRLDCRPGLPLVMCW